MKATTSRFVLPAVKHSVVELVRGNLPEGQDDTRSQRDAARDWIEHDGVRSRAFRSAVAYYSHGVEGRITLLEWHATVDLMLVIVISRVIVSAEDSS